MSIFNIILIIYIFSAVWSIITILFVKHYINHRLSDTYVRSAISPCDYDIRVLWRNSYIILSLIPFYNVFCRKSPLL